jgi:hypothetical protein
MAAIIFNGAECHAIPGNGYTPAAIDWRMDGPRRGTAGFGQIGGRRHGGWRRNQERHHRRFHGAPRLRCHGGKQPSRINASAFSRAGWHLRHAPILTARRAACTMGGCNASAFGAEQSFHRIGGGQGNAAAMAQPWRSRRRRQSRARCLGKASDYGFLRWGWADQRHRMARAKTGR